MASHHYGHPNPAVSCCRPHTYCCHPPPPPPPPQQTDIYPYFQIPSPQLDLYQHLSYPTPPPLPIHHSHEQFIHLRRKPAPEETYTSVSSLVRRIAALESSLLRHRISSAPAWSLRDIAARTIQMHFRSFLARRSRTLSQLKQLASIKSALHSLKASTSGNAQFDTQSISRKTKTLLQKLEFIQGGDPMIRDGKRSIYRELIRFKDLIDRVCFKRVVRSTQHRGNNSRVSSRVDFRDLSEDEKEFRGRSSGVANKSHRFMDDEEEDGFDIGVLPVKAGSSHRRSGGLLKKVGGCEGRVKKTVTFADDGKLYRATTATPERNSSGEEEEEGDEIELVDNLGRKVEEIGGSEDEDGTEMEEEEEEEEELEEEDFVFSAPLPVKMDRRAAAAADLMKKMKRDAAGNENR